MEEITPRQFANLVEKNRSCRRFQEEDTFSRKELENLIDMARKTASAANRQPLKYFISWRKEDNKKIFPALSWAGALKDWDGPSSGERPAGYIVILGDTRIAENYFCDPGIAAQTILLGARAGGRAGCIFAAIDREKLRENLSIHENFEILYVLALGTPAEEILLEDLEGENYNYWRDEEDVHHVPKRKLQDIIIN